MVRAAQSVFQRPGIAVANLIRDPVGTVSIRALMDPESLTPEEAKTISERWV